MGRILAIDWGRKRVGAAISDPTMTIATPLPTMDARPVKALLSSLRDIIRNEKVSTVVIGHPSNMNGSSSASSDSARKFGELLLKPFRGKVSLVLQDERLTSWSAKRVLRDLGEKPSKKTGRVDQFVAASILQEYLDGNAR